MTDDGVSQRIAKLGELSRKASRPPARLQREKRFVVSQGLDEKLVTERIAKMAAMYRLCTSFQDKV